MNERILNINDYPKGLPRDAIRVTRPSPWGNPYAARSVGGRTVAINLFRTYAKKRLQREPDWLEPLKGKRLACACAPMRCHAEVLIELGA